MWNMEHAYPSVTQPRRASLCKRIWIGDRVDHTCDAARKQRFRAGAGTTAVIARLKRHHRGCPAGTIASRAQRFHFCVGPTALAMKPLGNLLSVWVEENAANHRVRLCAAVTAESNADGTIKRGTNEIRMKWRSLCRHRVRR
jgi:hypothetical protein